MLRGNKKVATNLSLKLNLEKLLHLDIPYSKCIPWIIFWIPVLNILKIMTETNNYNNIIMELNKLVFVCFFFFKGRKSVSTYIMKSVSTGAA